MGNELLTILEYIERERGISREHLVRALETAILTASRKSIHPASDLQVKIDPQTGRIQAWAKLEVVESDPNNDQLLLSRARERFPGVTPGEKVEWEVTPGNFGRIAAQTAKQAIMQQLRQAEKETVSEEFSSQVGQIINGVVRRFEGGGIVIDFQRAEGILSSREKIHGEQYMPGERINALLLRVDTETAGPSLIVSRTHPDFIRRLFEREVAEIHDGVVEIKGLAREPGKRTKIAVWSSDPRVDAVGACVGMRGLRVRNITNELGMERVDIIPWDEDVAKYAMNALQPAKVQSVEVNSEKHELVVHVTAEQSKLAFGKSAQNVRLCSKLLGWNINIRQEGEAFEDKLIRAGHDLAAALGVEPATGELLVRNGFITIDGVRAAGREELLKIKGVDPAEIDRAFAEIGE